MKPKRVLSIGAAYLDINAPSFPHQGSLIADHELIGKGYHVEPGGSAINFVRVCHSLGLDTLFVGKTGNDTAGRTLSKLLSREDIKPVLISSDEAQTNIGISLINDEGSRLMVVVGSANQALKPGEVKEKIRSIVSGVDYLYLGGCFKMKSLMPIYVDLIDLAHQYNCLVILDHGNVTNEVNDKSRMAMQRIVQRADFYLPGKLEFMNVWGENSVEGAVDKLQKSADTTVIVTEGANGATAFSEAGSVHIPAFKVNVSNTVGAGDSFTAGFIRAHSLGRDLNHCLRFASATAALKISEPGLPTESKVNSLLA